MVCVITYSKVGLSTESLEERCLSEWVTFFKKYCLKFPYYSPLVIKNRSQVPLYIFMLKNCADRSEQSVTSLQMCAKSQKQLVFRWWTQQQDHWDYVVAADSKIKFSADNFIFSLVSTLIVSSPSPVCAHYHQVARVCAKVHQRLHFLKLFGVYKNMMLIFYSSAIEGILRYGITSKFGSLMVKTKLLHFQNLVKTASKIMYIHNINNPKKRSVRS